MLRRSILGLAARVLPVANDGFPPQQEQPSNDETIHYRGLEDTDALFERTMKATTVNCSVIGSTMSLIGVGLFGVTYGWNIAKPVYDAYTGADDGDD
jgi:hypothetical protein